MSRWAMHNPEAYERGELQMETVDIEAEMARDEARAPHGPLKPCACCGRLSRLHWCSVGCQRMEDGPQDDEEA